MSHSYRFSLKEKIGQLFMIGFDGTALSEEVRSFIHDRHIGFAALFTRNVETLEQVRSLTAEIHKSAAVPPMIYVDQEGGRIIRFKELAATVITPMGLAATGAPQNAFDAGRIIGSEMKAVGVDGVLAPVADVNTEPDNPVIGVRAFSDDPDTVITYARRFAAGLNSVGAAGCVKHYPGHGAAAKDSHEEMPTTRVSAEFFAEYCYRPFAEMTADGVDMVMSAHVLFPSQAPEMATFSPYLIDTLLREQAGYNGVIATDCLEMLAVKNRYSAEDIVKNVVGAGIDVLAVSSRLDYQKELFDALHFLVKKGTISERRIDASVERILKLKEQYPPASPAGGALPVRPHRNEEQRIADASITLLRNHRGLIPMDRSAKTLILEWGRTSEVETIARQYLSDAEVVMLPLDPSPEEEAALWKDLEPRLQTADRILAVPCSHKPESEIHQAAVINRVLEPRPDLMVAATGNPYDIRRFPGVETYLATYGYRQVQVEALFKVLTGKITASGRLPVDIKPLFPRGYSFGSRENETP